MSLGQNWDYKFNHGEGMENMITEYNVWSMMAIMVFEYVLGKTKGIKANSTIEAVLNMLASIGRRK